MTTSLAVRHRPHTWAAVAGQRHLVAVLRAAAARRPVPQQILLAGPSGVGKTTMARIFAAALFCPHAQDGAGCGSCDVCRDVTGPGGRHPDVIELDAASHGGIEQIRSLAGEASLAPLLAPWRIYIIDEAHGLTKDGAQAFLRLLEEPPAHTIFILATTDPQRLPDALRGRCLLCYATVPDRSEKTENLHRIAAEEHWDLSGEVLEVVVDATDPALGVRGTVTNLDKVAGGMRADGNLTPAQAAVLLGVADPALFAEMTTAIVGAEKVEALRCLTLTLAHSPRAQIHTQLLEWARTRLHADCAAGRAETASWFLQQLCTHPAEHLEVAIAKMADPYLGGTPALAALVERAETAAHELRNPAPTTAPTTAPATTPTATTRASTRTPGMATTPIVPAAGPPAPVQTADPILVPGPIPGRVHVVELPLVIDEPANGPSAAPAAAQSPPVIEEWVSVPPSDARLLAWCNAIAREDPMWALQLRRAHIERSPTGWRIGSLTDAEAGFVAALVAAADQPVRFS